MTFADEYYMTRALALAGQAADAGEVPIGAVVVDPAGRIIGQGHNQTERLADVTAHAEMIAITAATQYLGAKYLQGCTLYVTVEPCPMCAGAIGWSQLSRIVIGTGDPKRGYTSILRPGATPFHPRAQVETGVLADQCRAIIQDFFKTKRKCTTSS